MKKLVMIMGCALGLVLTSQASAYNWGITSHKDNASFASDTVYVLLASSWKSDITYSEVQSAALQTATYVTKIGKTGINSTAFAYGTTDVDGDLLDVVFVQVDSDGTEYFKWNYQLTSSKTTSSDPTITSFSSADMKNYASGGYTPFESVPEPTSGLLLVLGGAMLALRRRRA